MSMGGYELPEWSPCSPPRYDFQLAAKISQNDNNIISAINYAPSPSNMVTYQSLLSQSSKGCLSLICQRKRQQLVSRISHMSSFAPFCMAAFMAFNSCEVCAEQSLLNGKVLAVAAEKWQPWFVISKEDLGTIAYSGVSYKILQFLESALNFTSKIVRPPDGSWGSKDDSGRWGGMVGMVKRKEADFGLGKIYHFEDFS